MDSKISGQKLEEKQDICIVAKYLPQIFMLQRTVVTLQWRNLANTLLTE